MLVLWQHMPLFLWWLRGSLSALNVVARFLSNRVACKLCSAMLIISAIYSLVRVSAVLGFLYRWCLFGIHLHVSGYSHSDCWIQNSTVIISFNSVINLYLIQHSLRSWNWILDFKLNAWGLSQNVCTCWSWDSFLSVVTGIHAGQLWNHYFILFQALHSLPLCPD